MVVDYSQTINRFTQLDAYPLPKIENLVNNIAKYKVFSTVDLHSAYHQIPLDPSERHTALESHGKLYQFRRIPFGVTNEVACFQRKMDEFIKSNNINDCFACLENVTFCGATHRKIMIVT